LKVEPGDTIWILSQIHSPWGPLPVGLDARIDVKRIEACSVCGARRFIAANSSEWFPLAGASDKLRKLKTVAARSSSTELWADSEKPFGQSLQSIRLLESADLLIRWSKRLALKPLNFISYRLCDGTKAAFNKAKELLLGGRAIFWDRWGLPRRVAERRERANDRALNGYIMMRLRQSKFVWCIESPKYSAKGSYSEKERKEAKRLLKCPYFIR
jgi:hypothetical protein